MGLDLSQVEIRHLRGKSVGYFCPMNGGKTRCVVSELQRVHHTGYNFVAYNSSLNDRDGASLVVDGKQSYPALSKADIGEIKEDLEKRIELIFSQKVGEQGENGKIDIDGITHKKNVDLVGVAIDEFNLFCLSEKSTKEAINFIRWSRDQNFVLYVSGLLYDFRQMPFGHRLDVKPLLNYLPAISPTCKAAEDGVQCYKTAAHSQRLWSIDLAKRLLPDLVDGMSFYDFFDKECNLNSQTYVPAPFFDKTLRIEKKKDMVYLPTCDVHSQLPFKDDTFDLYDSIVNQKNLIENNLNSKILHFLLDENWVRKQEGKIVPTPIYRNRLGGFTPAAKLFSLG